MKGYLSTYYQSQNVYHSLACSFTRPRNPSDIDAPNLILNKGDRLEIYEWRPKGAYLSDVHTQKDPNLNMIERRTDEKISLALEPVLMVPLGSRAIQIATLPVTEELDYLVLMTHELQLFIISWNNAASVMSVKYQVDLKDRVGRPLERKEGPIISVDSKGKWIALMVTQGLLKLIKVTSKRQASTKGVSTEVQLGSMMHLRMDVLKIHDLLFCHSGNTSGSSSGSPTTGSSSNSAEFLLAVLYSDIKEERFLQFFELDGTNTNALKTYKNSNINHEVGLLVDKLTSRLFQGSNSNSGFWALGQGVLTWISFPFSNSSCLKKRFCQNDPDWVTTAFTPLGSSTMVGNGRLTNRWLMGDSNGHLYLVALQTHLNLSKNNTTAVVSGGGFELVIEKLGITSVAACLTAYSDGVVFVGSSLGDHQWLQLTTTTTSTMITGENTSNTCLAEQTFFQEIARILNLGPILDMVHTGLKNVSNITSENTIAFESLNYLDNNGTLVVACGGRKDSALAVLQKGVPTSLISSSSVGSIIGAAGQRFGSECELPKGQPIEMNIVGKRFKETKELPMFIFRSYPTPNFVILSTNKGVFRESTDDISTALVLLGDKSDRVVDVFPLYDSNTADIKWVLVVTRKSVIYLDSHSGTVGKKLTDQNIIYSHAIQASSLLLIDEKLNLFRHDHHSELVHLGKISLEATSTSNTRVNTSSASKNVNTSASISAVALVPDSTLVIALWQDPRHIYLVDLETLSLKKILPAPCPSKEIVIKEIFSFEKSILVVLMNGGIFECDLNELDCNDIYWKRVTKNKATRFIGISGNVSNNGGAFSGTFLLTFRDRLILLQRSQSTGCWTERPLQLTTSASITFDNPLSTRLMSAAAQFQDHTPRKVTYYQETNGILKKHVISLELDSSPSGLIKFKKWTIGEPILGLISLPYGVIVFTKNIVHLFDTDDMTVKLQVNILQFIKQIDVSCRSEMMANIDETSTAASFTAGCALDETYFVVTISLNRTLYLVALNSNLELIAVTTLQSNLSTNSTTAVYTMTALDQTTFLVALGPLLLAYKLVVLEDFSCRSETVITAGTTTLRATLELVKNITGYGQILPLHLSVLGNNLLVGDLMKSISLFELENTSNVNVVATDANVIASDVNDRLSGISGHHLREVARDFNARWVTAISFISPTLFLVSDHDAKLYLLRRLLDDGRTPLERARLQTIFMADLSGKMVQKILPLTASIPTAVSTDNNSPFLKQFKRGGGNPWTSLAGTPQGAILFLAFTEDPIFAELSKVQSEMISRFPPLASSTSTTNNNNAKSVMIDGDYLGSLVVAGKLTTQSSAAILEVLDDLTFLAQL